MLGNFSYCNPTKLYFGAGSLKALHEELPKYGKEVVEDWEVENAEIFTSNGFVSHSREKWEELYRFGRSL